MNRPERKSRCRRLLVEALFYAAPFSLGVGLSWLLALAGEPQALWLWRDVLGVIQR